jgi:hypothetical protein
MAALRQLIGLLATELDIPRARVERVAHHLRRREVLPWDSAVPLTADHAAAMLIAVMATGEFAAYAPYVVGIYGQLPARGIHLSAPLDGGGHRTRFVAIENVPIKDGTGPAFVDVTRNLRSCLAAMIDMASSRAPDAYDAALPRSIMVSRDTAVPSAYIELGPMPTEPDTDRLLFFVLCEDDFDASKPAKARLSVSATVGGHVVKALGRLLGRPSVPGSRCMPAPVKMEA